MQTHPDVSAPNPGVPVSADNAFPDLFLKYFFAHNDLMDATQPPQPLCFRRNPI